ncbi:hypothetical protein HPP92_010626 [Vanilla planifolia]|uniref:Uncharacterized protein n=1 Tax=Vanilla planifolia TaxID=51239 RepID=A0A835UZY9_VANPL|nr:hypothetical protein HPP92_010626 [Vanilla planifolia]
MDMFGVTIAIEKGVSKKVKMDARHSAEIYKHLEEQSKLLIEAYRAMSHELHTLHVEEEMLMRKLYEHMLAEGLIKKNEDTGGSTKMIVGNMRFKKDKERNYLETRSKGFKQRPGYALIPATLILKTKVLNVAVIGNIPLLTNLIAAVYDTFKKHKHRVYVK